MSHTLPPASEWHLRFERFGLGCHLRSLPVYRGLFDRARGQYPHLPRLSGWEFAAALRHPGVGKAVLRVEGRTFALPLLGPAAADPSLSAPYYARIERARSIRVVHFFTLPGFIPGPDGGPSGLLAHLATLPHGHALSYVVAQAGQECGPPVRDMATAAGLAPSEPEHLGGQKFFIGKYYLLHIREHLPPRQLMDAYRELAAESGSVPMARFREILGDEESGHLWQVYHQKFNDVASKHPYDQTMDVKTFQAIARNPAVIKMVAYDGSGRPQAMIPIGSQGAFPSEIDTSFFAKRFPDNLTYGHVLFVTTLFGIGDAASQSYPRHIMRLLAAVLERAGSAAVIVFDVQDRACKALLSLIKRYCESTHKVRVLFDEVGAIRCQLLRIGKGRAA